MKTQFFLLFLAAGLAASATAQGVRITEFKAQNSGPLRDEDLETSDWIEIYNDTGTNVNLNGWFLTDVQTNLTQWSFPATNLDAGRFLIVFASGKDRRVPGKPLHTSFSLRGSGEYLALVQPDGTNVAQAFGPAYPAQYNWLSYGFAMNGPTVLARPPVYLPPTPGAANPPPQTPPPLVLTEIMFNPAPDMSGLTEQYEFLEVMNAGSEPLNVNGIYFTAGVSIGFWNPFIDPGQRVVLTPDYSAFQQRYGTNVIPSGAIGGSLSDAGERLTLIASNGAVIFDFAYVDSWHRLADGHGFSLVPVNESGSPAFYGQRRAWRTSGQRDGSPGLADPPSTIPPIYVNEVLTRAEAPFEDAIELFNPNPFDMDISGWLLTDNFDEPLKYIMPAGAVVPAGGYLALDEHAFNGPNDDPLAIGFGLGDFGEEIYLFSTDASGVLNGFVHGFEYGTAEPNVTFGRHVISTGEDHLVPQTAMSFLGPNTGPKPVSVVFTEIRPHPAEVVSAAGRIDTYIELRNVSAQPVALFDPQFPTNTWRLQNPQLGGAVLDFPVNTVLPPGAYALVVGFSPTNTAMLSEFALSNRVTPGTFVFGPWPGALGDGGGSIELLRPDAPQPLFVPYFRVERLDYDAMPPWPALNRGECLSLHRAAEHAYGNDPTNWIAGQITPGLAAGLPPSVVPSLPDQRLHAGSPVVFNATAEGGTPTIYQWYFNGTAIAGANHGVLQFTSLQPGHAGYYSCYVSNALAAGFTCAAALEVFDTNRPVVVITAPVGIRWRANGSPFSFLGSASDDTQLSSVWVQRGDSTPVPATGLGAWGATLNLNPGLNTLRAFAIDWAGNVSTTATITVLLAPDPARLSLLRSGEGVVSGPTNGQSLVSGRRYTLRATPMTGNTFSHWLDWQTGLTSTNPVYTFTMSSNRVIAAQFEATPFVNYFGDYNGLFQSDSATAHLGAGYFTLRITGRGAYSGRLSYRGVSHALHGQFGTNLQAAQTINRVGTNELQLTLSLTDDFYYPLIGTVTEARFTSAITGHRSGFSPSSVTSEYAGRYVVSFSSFIADTNVTSAAVVSVNAAGRATLRGRLPDRTPVVKSLLAGDDTQVPFYHPLYGNTGSAFGWLVINGSFSGTLQWERTGKAAFSRTIEVYGER